MKAEIKDSPIKHIELWTKENEECFAEFEIDIERQIVYSLSCSNLLDQNGLEILLFRDSEPDADTIEDLREEVDDKIKRLTLLKETLEKFIPKKRR